MITEDELELLNQCRTANQWKMACNIIKSNHSGDYPSDWWKKVKTSGMMDRIMANWGETSELKVSNL